MRAIKNKRNWNQLFALPDPELLSLLNQKRLNIKKNYKGLPILKGRQKQMQEIHEGKHK